jgi:hypothetical protein
MERHGNRRRDVPRPSTHGMASTLHVRLALIALNSVRACVCVFARAASGGSLVESTSAARARYHSHAVRVPWAPARRRLCYGAALPPWTCCSSSPSSSPPPSPPPPPPSSSLLSLLSKRTWCGSRARGCRPGFCSSRNSIVAYTPGGLSRGGSNQHTARQSRVAGDRIPPAAQVTRRRHAWCSVTVRTDQSWPPSPTAASLPLGCPPPPRPLPTPPARSPRESAPHGHSLAAAIAAPPDRPPALCDRAVDPSHHLEHVVQPDRPSHMPTVNHLPPTVDQRWHRGLARAQAHLHLVVVRSLLLDGAIGWRRRRRRRRRLLDGGVPALVCHRHMLPRTRPNEQPPVRPWQRVPASRRHQYCCQYLNT